MHAMELPLRKIIGFCEHFLFSREAFSLSFGKKYILQHSFIIPLSIQQTNKHLFIHSAPSFRKCLLSFWTGIRQWARHRMLTETARAPTLSVCLVQGLGLLRWLLLASGISKIIHFFSFVNSTSACWEAAMPFSFCLFVAMTGWFTEDRVCSKIKEGAGTPLGHARCPTTAILPGQSIRTPDRVPVLPSRKQQKGKGKGMMSQACHPTSTPHLFYSITRVSPWHFSYIQCVINMLVIVITSLTRYLLGV